jgi:uncharacterized protein (DUF2236 family)
MIFGTVDQALSASRQLYRLHTRVQGELPQGAGAHPQGSRYAANDVHALAWVYATLIDSAVIAFETVLLPLTVVERETYYAESKTLAALFGIPAAALPEDWAGFEAYKCDLLASNVLAVNELSRELAERVLHGRGSSLPVPRWYRALTTLSMPERLRGEFQLSWGRKDAELAAKALKRLPRFYKLLPEPVRFVGPYREAQCRLLGRPVDALTRVSNRFWMGQPRMMLAEFDD